MLPIPTLFGSLFTSCTETENKPDPEPELVSFTINECDFSGYYYEAISYITASESDLIPLLDADGQITEDACKTICTDVGAIDFVCSCEYVGETNGNYNFECTAENYIVPYEGRANAEISKNSNGIGPNPICKLISCEWGGGGSGVAPKAPNSKRRRHP